MFAYNMCAQGNLTRVMNHLFNNVMSFVLDAIMKEPEPGIKKLLTLLKCNFENEIKSKNIKLKYWKECREKYYCISLDYKTFDFKVKERKNIKKETILKNITQRYYEKNKESISELVKKGGTEQSLYFYSYNIFDLEEYHIKPIEGDKIAALSSLEVNKYAVKLPQFQLRFDNDEIFKDTCKLVLWKLSNVHYVQIKREKVKNTVYSLI